MPSSEEFSNRGAPMTPEKMQALQARAREIRQARAAGAPIPGTGFGVAPVEQTQSEWYPQPVPLAHTYEPAPTPLLSSGNELEQVRTRFKLASYYEALLEQPAFGDSVNTDVYAATVQAELTEWVTGRMSELAGIRNSPEGFVDDEVQLLKSLARGLGDNGVRAVVFLADRIVNPPAPQPARTPDLDLDLTLCQKCGQFLSHGHVCDIDQYGDVGPSAISLAPAPPATPTPITPVQPQVQPAKPKRPYVRRAKVPGQSDIAVAVSVPPAVETEPSKRGRKRSGDPLAAGKALVAQATQPGTMSSPGAAQAVTAPISAPVSAAQQQPVPMPRGLAMSMAMEQKAGEALSDAHVIQATGGGVM